MSSSPRPAGDTWTDHDPQAEFDLLVQDPPPPAYVPKFPHQNDADDEAGFGAYDEPDEDDAYFEEMSIGTEYSGQVGLPGRGVIIVSIAASLACAGLNFALVGGLTMFFDLCFIVICLIGAMSVRRRDLFTTGVLAPLAFAGVIGLVAIMSPSAFADSGGFSKIFLTGLAAHAGALVAGYGIALATVGGRVSASSND